MTRVVCRQLAPAVGDVALNQSALLAALRDSVTKGADIVAFPELVTCGYVFTSAEEARSVAVPSDSPILLQWAEALRGTSTLAIGGFAELGDDGSIYNSAALVDASGVRAVYRKAHLWNTEKLIFRSGDAPPPILKTPLGRISMMICYDLEFPEFTRAVALAGADLILVPANWPRSPTPDGERPFEITIAMSAARVNHVAIACCDRTGTERGQEWTGGTTVIDENGWIVATAGSDGVAYAELDLSRARDKAFTPRSDAFGDRRPSLYNAMYGRVLSRDDACPGNTAVAVPDPVELSEIPKREH